MSFTYRCFQCETVYHGRLQILRINGVEQFVCDYCRAEMGFEPAPEIKAIMEHKAALAAHAEAE